MERTERVHVFNVRIVKWSEDPTKRRFEVVLHEPGTRIESTVSWEEWIIDGPATLIASIVEVV